MRSGLKRNNTIARHFPYKHPLFGTKNNPKSGSNSVYYYWWAFLKRNKDYLACCQAGGKGSLSKLYADFGDVRGDSFKEWWSSDGRGVRLFAEPTSASVEVLKSGVAAPNASEYLTLALPKNLPKRYLLRRIGELLSKEENHPGARGRQHARMSKAKFQVKGQPNLAGLALTLKVYDFKVANPHLKLWEIGDQLPRFMVGNKISNKDTHGELVSKRNVLAASVARYVKKAEVMIASTSAGELF
jgi:hypothetical protein